MNMTFSTWYAEVDRFRRLISGWRNLEDILCWILQIGNFESFIIDYKPIWTLIKLDMDLNLAWYGLDRGLI